jgi:hypothetical protein
MSKPWNNIDKNNQNWFRSSNHKHFTKDLIDIQAFILVQDCNQGGNYYRIICWDSNNERYFDVKGDSDWIFNIKLNEMKRNSVVTYTITGQNYKVCDSKDFFKILEKID